MYEYKSSIYNFVVASLSKFKEKENKELKIKALVI